MELELSERSELADDKLLSLEALLEEGTLLSELLVWELRDEDGSLDELSAEGEL